jgi:hypothetical protein
MLSISLLPRGNAAQEMKKRNLEEAFGRSADIVMYVGGQRYESGIAFSLDWP